MKQDYKEIKAEWDDLQEQISDTEIKQEDLGREVEEGGNDDLAEELDYVDELLRDLRYDEHVIIEVVRKEYPEKLSKCGTILL